MRWHQRIFKILKRRGVYQSVIPPSLLNCECSHVSLYKFNFLWLAHKMISFFSSRSTSPLPIDLSALFFCPFLHLIILRKTYTNKFFTLVPKTSMRVEVVLSWVLRKPSRYLMSGPALGRINKLK